MHGDCVLCRRSVSCGQGIHDFAIVFAVACYPTLVIFEFSENSVCLFSLFRFVIQLVEKLFVRDGLFRCISQLGG